jgi:hypothetical protein
MRQDRRGSRQKSFALDKALGWSAPGRRWSPSRERRPACRGRASAPPGPLGLRRAGSRGCLRQLLRWRFAWRWSTLCNVERSDWRRDRQPGMPPGRWPRAGGANRESRTRPYETPSGGIGGGMGSRGCGRRDLRISNTTLCNVERWDWRRDRQPGMPPGRWPRADGAIRESRQRPYEPPRGGIGGGTGSRGCRPAIWPCADGAIRESRQRPYETPRGGIGGEAGPRGCRPAIGPCANGAIRESRQRPYETPRGGIGRVGPDPADADQRSGLVWTGQFANLDKDPMKRRAVGLAEGLALADADQRSGLVWTGQCANLDKDPMNRRAVGLVEGPALADADQ